MFSLALSPSSNRRMSQANRMVGPVPTVNKAVKTGDLRCHRSLRSQVGHRWFDTSHVMCDHSDVFAKEISKQGVVKYFPACFYLYFFLFRTKSGLTGPRFCLHEFAVEHDTFKQDQKCTNI